jgi:hypothetical protein
MKPAILSTQLLGPSIHIFPSQVKSIIPTVKGFSIFPAIKKNVMDCNGSVVRVVLFELKKMILHDGSWYSVQKN